jgi:hypothetical protein
LTANTFQLACEMHCIAVAVPPPSTLAALAKAANTQSLSTVFTGLTDMNSTLSRIAGLVLFDPASAEGLPKMLFGCMVNEGVDGVVRGVMGEKMMELLEEGAHRHEVGGLIIELGQLVLGIYTSELYPIRRLRCNEISMV